MLLLSVFLAFSALCQGRETRRPTGAPGRRLLDIADHKYKPGEYVPLFANKIGPYNNPTETYQYYDLPFCTPKEGIQHQAEDLGEVLEGDRLSTTPYKLNFLVDKDRAILCEKKMGSPELDKLREAVDSDYYFQFFYDDLPVWGFIGKMEKLFHAGKRKDEIRRFLFTHLHFDIAHNGESVIEINVSTDPERAVDITELKGAEIEFSYSVKWRSTTIPFDRRLDKYSRHSFLPQNMEVHWFSIINSIVTVLLLTGFLITILMRVLRRDFMRFTSDPEAGDLDEGGWKYVHGDVFRFPRYKNLFCACLGTGLQLLVMALSVFVLAMVGWFLPYNRGEMLSALVLLYASTAGIAGYYSTRLYRQMGGRDWANNVLLTTVLFCGPVFATFMYLNTIAIIYRSTQAMPFGTILIILVIWALVTFPLTVWGGIKGKNSKGEFATPCRTNKLPRQVPPLPWYRATPVQMLVAGFLPFSAIYVELAFLFASVWGHKVYTIWSILAVVFVILLIVTAFTTVALTYFQLSVEDYRWWWRAFLCGGATGVYVYGYSFYYYFFRSEMDSFLQFSYYFGWNAVICYGFFLMLGFVGWRSALTFVRRIYFHIRID